MEVYLATAGEIMIEETVVGDKISNDGRGRSRACKKGGVTQGSPLCGHMGGDLNLGADLHHLQSVLLCVALFLSCSSGVIGHGVQHTSFKVFGIIIRLESNLL